MSRVQSLGQEDPLEDMANHSSILAWKTPWTEEPGKVHRVSKSQRQLTGFYFFILPYQYQVLLGSIVTMKKKTCNILFEDHFCFK